MSLWLTICAAGLVTYATRLSFIFLLDRIPVPGWFRRGLRFVPIAVLSAIILPETLTRGGAIDLSLRNPQLWSAALAALVAWRTRNALLTIAAGIVALLAARAVFGA